MMKRCGVYMYIEHRSMLLCCNNSVRHRCKKTFIDVQIPSRVEIWFKISAPPAPHSQLSYDEHTDTTLSVERWDCEGEDWPPTLIC